MEECRRSVFQVSPVLTQVTVLGCLFRDGDILGDSGKKVTQTKVNIRSKVLKNIVKPESKSPIPCPNRPQILTLRSDQVLKTKKPNSLDWAD